MVGNRIAAPACVAIGGICGGVTQPRLNDLMRGRINKFSLDALMNLAVHPGLSVSIDVARPAA